VALAISVFAWGLQYKLSLYSPAIAVSCRVPIVKLLSDDQVGAESGEHSASPSGHGILPVQLAFHHLAISSDIADHQLAVARRLERHEPGITPPISPFLLGLASSFLRPPPHVFPMDALKY
jgi:hypothetical protein